MECKAGFFSCTAHLGHCRSKVASADPEEHPEEEANRVIAHPGAVGHLIPFLARHV